MKAQSLPERLEKPHAEAQRGRGAGVTLDLRFVDHLCLPALRLRAFAPLRHAFPCLEFRHLLLALSAASIPLVAAPQWKAPKELRFGQLEVLELREDDPAAKPLPRPVVDEKLGSLRLRALEPLADGKGWRFQVQALEPGTAVIPALDLGDGRRAPELRLPVPRVAPHGAPWMGWGGGREDQLPEVAFPYGWAAAALSPLLLLAVGLLALWRRGAAGRRQHAARNHFTKAWPPVRERSALDKAHAAGRELLGAHFGEAALAWGPEDFRTRGLDPWVQWTQSLDAARFGLLSPPFPETNLLLKNLEAKAHDVPAPKGGRR
jgi:hypothetical protein